jgi:hypothetical protein
LNFNLKEAFNKIAKGESTIEEEAKLLDLEAKSDLINSRKKYARYAFFVSGIWLTVVLIILLFQGFKWWSFNLDSSVLIAMLGTTTTNIIGLCYIVLKYVFATDNSK